MSPMTICSPRVGPARPVRTYRTAARRPSTARKGSRSISPGFQLQASAKSSRSRARHIRDAPQPGHHSPVTAWKGQGSPTPVTAVKAA